VKSPKRAKSGSTRRPRGGTLTDLRVAALNASGAAALVLTGNKFFHNDVPLVIGSFNVDDSNLFRESETKEPRIREAGLVKKQ
jgi:hypothetical protein